ncbi:MAG: hypothetical protein ACRD3M_04970 [Thermoanaerobaculia bacterium]
MARVTGDPLTEDGRRKTGDEQSRQVPFLPILLYVFGFLLILAVLAFALSALLRP